VCVNDDACEYVSLMSVYTCVCDATCYITTYVNIFVIISGRVNVQMTLDKYLQVHIRRAEYMCICIHT